MDLQAFRNETREWLDANCPQSMRNKMVHFEEAFEIYDNDDARLWKARCAERGWIAPLWPKEYGGAGMSGAEYKVLQEEMAALKVLPPDTGMGLAMIGPTLLEYGTEAQKQEHLPRSQKAKFVGVKGTRNLDQALTSPVCRREQYWRVITLSSMDKRFGRRGRTTPTGCSHS